MAEQREKPTAEYICMKRNERMAKEQRDRVREATKRAEALKEAAKK